jgi:hypothetical protein
VNIPTTLTPPNFIRNGYVQFMTAFTATSTSTPLVFGERDNPSFLALDDVSVFQGPPPNQVQNGGFETGDFSGWTGSSNANIGIGGPTAGGFGGYIPHSGNYYAALGASGSLGSLFQTIPTVAGAQYSLTFWYASNGLSPNELQAFAGGFKLFDQVNIPSTNGYAEFSTTFTATSTTTFLNFGERDDSSYLALDDVSVVLAPPPPNLVVNGGFEAGNFSGWTLSGNARVSCAVFSTGGGYSAHGGNYFAALGTPGLPGGTLSQTLATTAGLEYLVTFWYASDGSNPNELKLSINGGTAADLVNIPSTGGLYNEFTGLYFTATGSSTLLQFNERDDPGYLALDDVSVVAMPSGASHGGGGGISPTGPSVVQNGRFEAGNFSGWTLSGAARLTCSVTSAAGGYGPHTGSFYAALGTAGSLGTISQTVPTVPGTFYDLTFWFASDGSSTNELSVSIGGTTVFDQRNISATHGYVQLDAPFTATSSSTLIQFGERDDSGYLALDDVSVAPLPFLLPPPPAGGGLPPPPLLPLAAPRVTFLPGDGPTQGTPSSVSGPGSTQSEGLPLTTADAGSHRSELSKGALFLLFLDFGGLVLA